jgi:hypothetical protein
VGSLRAITRLVEILSVRPLVLVATLVLGAAVAAAGCTCFPVGCVDPLVIKVVPQSGAFPAVGNTIVAEFDGQTVQCQFSWPRDVKERCGNDSVGFPIKVPAENAFEITFSGRPQRPARVKIKYLAGAVAAEKEFVPRYQEQEKRPDSCGGPCELARETWMVP